jgi:NAD(P)-dependent dehydrogenase (short-subunit alcohol dehydrogenase family)
MHATVVIVGATGVVGQGIAEALVAGGHRVVGVARSEHNLARLAERLAPTNGFTFIAGDVSSDLGAARLADALRPGKPDVIINALNAPAVTGSAFDLSGEEVVRALQENLGAHLAAAKHLIPLLGPDGLYLGLGGGMADLVIPGNAANSMVQAALRALFNYLDLEKRAPLRVRELLFYSMILPGKEASATEPYRITAYEVGQHIAAIIAQPALFAGPILTLKSRKQVGRGAQA